MAGKRVDVNWLGRMTTYENLVVKSRGMAPLFSVGRPGTAPPGFHWREAGEKGGHGGKLVRRKAGNWTVEFPGKLASDASSRPQERPSPPHSQFDVQDDDSGETQGSRARRGDLWVPDNHRRLGPPPNNSYSIPPRISRTRNGGYSRGVQCFIPNPASSVNSVASEILTGLRRHPGWELGREFDKISDEEVSAIECFVDEGIIKDVYMECGILWMSEIENEDPFRSHRQARDTNRSKPQRDHPIPRPKETRYGPRQKDNMDLVNSKLPPRFPYTRFDDIPFRPCSNRDVSFHVASRRHGAPPIPASLYAFNRASPSMKALPMPHRPDRRFLYARPSTKAECLKRCDWVIRQYTDEHLYYLRTNPTWRGRPIHVHTDIVLMLQLLVVEFYEENEDWVEHRLVDLSDGIELERDPKTRERKHDLFVNLNRHFGEGRRDFAEKRRALAQRSRNAGGRRH